MKIFFFEKKHFDRNCLPGSACCRDRCRFGRGCGVAVEGATARTVAAVVATARVVGGRGGAVVETRLLVVRVLRVVVRVVVGAVGVGHCLATPAPTAVVAVFAGAGFLALLVLLHLHASVLEPDLDHKIFFFFNLIYVNFMIILC